MMLEDSREPILLIPRDISEVKYPKRTTCDTTRPHAYTALLTTRREIAKSSWSNIQSGDCRVCHYETSDEIFFIVYVVDQIRTPPNPASFLQDHGFDLKMDRLRRHSLLLEDDFWVVGKYR